MDPNNKWNLNCLSQSLYKVNTHELLEFNGKWNNKFNLFIFLGNKDQSKVIKTLLVRNQCN